MTKQTPFLRVEDGILELIGFVDELEMLLYNIKGNRNYEDNFCEGS